MKHSPVCQCNECQRLELLRRQNSTRYGYYPITDNIQHKHKKVYKMGTLWKWIKRIVAIAIISILIWCVYGAFNGIQPFSDYKDSIQDYISGLFSKQEQQIKVVTREYVLFENKINIYIEPTTSTIPEEYYKIILYKNGVELDYKIVVWQQRELNKLLVKSATFNIPENDYSAYIWVYQTRGGSDPFGSVFTIGITEASKNVYEAKYYRDTYDFMFFH
jgi:hypothetical protein